MWNLTWGGNEERGQKTRKKKPGGGKKTKENPHQLSPFSQRNSKNLVGGIPPEGELKEGQIMTTKSSKCSVANKETKGRDQMTGHLRRRGKIKMSKILFQEGKMEVLGAKKK